MTTPIRQPVASAAPDAHARGVGRLVLATAVGSLGLGAGGTAGAIVAEAVTGSAAAAGLPLGLLVLGSAAGALLIARVGRRWSREVGLVAGYVAGAVGALLVIVATERDQFALVLAGSLLLGASNAAIFLTRYAAADRVQAHRRGRALGSVLAGTAVGAVAGVFLLGPSGTVAAWVGLSEVVGLYMLAVPAFVVAAALLAWDASRGPADVVSAGRQPPERGIRSVLRDHLGDRTVALALVLLAVGNLVMVAVMVVIPVHLDGHGHDLDRIGLLVGIHVVGMFGPSPLTGQLADSHGAPVVGLTGIVILLATVTVWAMLGTTAMLAAGLLLTTLGVGWNAAVVGGSALLSTRVHRQDRLDVEAAGEVVMGVAAGVGAPLAGLLVASGGFAGLCLAAAVACGAVLAYVTQARPALR